jgi:light-regulated signal transduction histidine kinase (bacteriophytochrome)
VKRCSATTNIDKIDQHINGFMNLLVKCERERMDKTFQYNLRVIAESKQEMNGLINIVHNLSRIDDMGIIDKPNEMGALVREVRAKLTLDPSHKSTKLRFKRSFPSLEVQICFIR